MYRYEIVVGLHDLLTNKEIMSNKEFMKFIEEMFKKDNKPFSVSKSIGGYLYSSNKYIIEHGVLLTLIGYSDDEVYKYADIIKNKLKQDAVLVIKKEIDVKYE